MKQHHHSPAVRLRNSTTSNGHTFEKQYKEVLSGFRYWDQLEYEDQSPLFPEQHWS